MSNYKEQLQQNNNELSAILETVEGLSEGGSGGTSVETCTVTITTNNNYATIYYCSSQGGTPTISHYVPEEYTYTLSDVVCGSLIYIPILSTIPAYIINGNASFIDRLVMDQDSGLLVFQIKTSAGETVILELYDDE